MDSGRCGGELFARSGPTRGGDLAGEAEVITGINKRVRRKYYVAVLSLGAALAGVASPGPAEDSSSPAQPVFPHAAPGAKVGEVTSEAAIIHSYLLTRSPEPLLQQPYVERKYVGMRGEVAVEYTSSEASEFESRSLPFSPENFRRYRAGLQNRRFTRWWKVPQNHTLTLNSHDPASVERLREAKAGDYSVRIRLEGLEAATRYRFRLWVRAGENAQVRSGAVQEFSTAPAADDPADVGFLAVTCFNYGKMKDVRDGKWPVEGFRLFRAILDRVKAGKLSFDFAVFNGDTVYLDKQGRNYRKGRARQPDQMRDRYFDSYLTPLAREFFARFPAYFQKDDHDWRFNDADPIFNPRAHAGKKIVSVGKYYRGEPSGWLGKIIFEEMHPVERGADHPPYRTFRWGKGLQIWILESRECRHPNARRLRRYDIPGLRLPDASTGNSYLYYPDYCGEAGVEDLWGKKQIAWLLRTLKESDAYFKIIVSPTPVLGPDQKIYPQFAANPFRRKQDNHVVRFREEFGRLLDALEREKLRNVYFVSGDRHFIWHSRYRRTEGDFALEEFGSGPFADDIHASGKLLYKNEQGTGEVVKKLNNPGFLHVQVKNVALQPRLVVEWYAVKDWEAPSIRLWGHRFEAPYLP